jgi:hypothetical protein
MQMPTAKSHPTKPKKKNQPKQRREREKLKFDLLLPFAS